jgi:hypothetical protein
MMAPCSVKAYGGKRGSRCFREPVTICDRFMGLGFCGSNSKNEICRKPGAVPFDGLVQGLGGNAVKARKIGVENDPCVSDDLN